MLEYLQRKKNESGPALSQLDQLLPIEPLLSAVQAHTTTHYMFYREQLDPHLLRPVLTRII
jgi:hypothetical protein